MGAQAPGAEHGGLPRSEGCVLHHTAKGHAMTMTLERWFFDKLQHWVDAHRAPTAGPGPSGPSMHPAGAEPAPAEGALAGVSAADAPPPAAERPAVACGWFDSTHELQRGLQVLEHAEAETLARELPLRDWLLLHLSAGPVAQAAQHRAGQGVVAGWAVQVGAGEGPVAA
jgi:hypothetical protein